MALLKFKHGSSAGLAETAISDGTVYITKDSQEMKVDIGTTRYNISDFVIVEDAAALEAINTYYENLFYFVKEGNLLKKYDGTKLVDLNNTTDLEADLGNLGQRLITAETDINNIEDRATSLETAIDNINASTIETTQDIIVTAAVGNYTKGSKVAMDDIQTIIKNMLSTDIDASVTTNVSASLSLSGSGSKEVGTTFTPSYSFSTNAGAYSQYRDPDTGTMTDQPTGVTFSSYVVNETGRPENSGDNGTANTKTGSFTSFVVTEALTSTNPYKLTGSCISSDGNVPKTYLGIDDPDNQIKQKTWSNLSSGTVTGYRAMFYGYFDSKTITDPTQITSAEIRALSGARLKSDTTYETKTGPQTSLPSGAKAIKTNKMQQMFFAAPKEKYTSVAVANSTNGAPQTVTKITDVMVEGANGYEAAAYDVWYVSNAGAESGETIFDVTIS